MRRLSRLAKPFVAISLVILGGCSTTTGSVGIEATFCGSSRPIYWSKNDTSGTVGQVKEHNSTGRALCGWGKKG